MIFWETITIIEGFYHDYHGYCMFAPIKLLKICNISTHDFLFLSIIAIKK